MVFEPAVMKETDRLRIIARESEAHWGCLLYTSRCV